MKTGSDNIGASPANLCSLARIQRPVLLAPMAARSGGALTAAVSKAGGLGFLGGGYGDLKWVNQQMGLVGDAAFGIGLITWNMAPGALDAVLSHRPRAVWLSFGDPTPHIDTIKAAGALAVCQVGTVDEAIAAASAGADVVVAQGSEAGGHGRPGRALFGLLPAISRALPETPLVAAGGINDRAGFEAAKQLGAAGVALGTAYYASAEALDTDAAKQHMVSSRGDDTIHSRVYDHVRGPLWPDGYTGRTIRTTLTDQWAGREDELAGVVQPIQEDHARAVRDDDMSVRVVFAGEGLDGIDQIVPAGDITSRFPIVNSEASAQR